MPKRHIVPEGSRKTIFTKNKKWMGCLTINNPIGRPLCATMGKWHRANQDNYFTEDYVMSANRPSLVDYKWEDESLRRITPLEGLRYQGFSDENALIFDSLGLSVTNQYRMIGNAVPVNLAQEAFKHLINHA